MLKARIAVLVSGGGTNLQALIDAQTSGQLCSGGKGHFDHFHKNTAYLERSIPFRNKV